MEYYSAVRKKGILPLVATWMDLEYIINISCLHTKPDKSGRERQVLLNHVHVESKNLNPVKKKQTIKWRLPGGESVWGMR